MSPGTVAEEQFALYLQSQDPQHLSAVFESVKSELMNTARRAGLDEQGAEDVVQETFLGVIESKDRFEPGRPCLPWIRGIAKRQLSAERRRRARLQMPFEPSDASPEEWYLSTRNIHAVELTTKIEGALESLSGGNRQVLHAALFEGQSVDELSERFRYGTGAIAANPRWRRSWRTQA